MIAFANQVAARPATPDWHEGFMQLLPSIKRFLRHAFRRLPREARQEAVQEAIANCLAAYARLVERGEVDRAFATPLARFAVAQYRAGRRVGTKMNVLDVTSAYCQKHKKCAVVRLHHFDDRTGQWQELIREDKHSGPADIAACRIDFRAWLRQLDRRKRAVALCLARGEATGEAARRFGVSPGRISQLRQELKESWEMFQSQAAALAAA